jgi:hypothetical protein
MPHQDRPVAVAAASHASAATASGPPTPCLAVGRAMANLGLAGDVGAVVVER